MKIKVHANAKGHILAAAIPPERSTKNLVQGGPMISGKEQSLDIDLPKVKEMTKLNSVLANSMVKRVNDVLSLSPLGVSPSKPKSARNK